ncbi:restriction endonuclease subunit S, partial [Escherichia coli]
KAQKYIGDKVRQAEQLRAWAKRLALSIEDLLTSSDDYLSACRTPEKKITRPQLSDLSNRLDPKYYGNKAIAVHRFTRKTGTPLAALIKSVANGFEERSFIENGLAYITVSEVSSGRLDAQSAPKISKSIDVPQKAVIHETCVLVVRTGSIGTAVKVHALDKGCAISSHLIRLEFEDEETAAAVAVFLNSSAGKVLLHKISYGAVQPQIGQEELLALNIPEYVLNEKTQCLALLNSYELAIRSSKSLTVSAKNLVEALIEGQLTEQQLIQAQQALEDGDNSFDQAILSKLSAEGYAIEGATPLFSDVDELYSLLEEAAQAEAEE